MSLARVFLGALLVASLAQAESEGVRLKAYLDWSEKSPNTKRARWHPVHIELASNVAKDLQGTVHVEIERGNSQVLDLRYQRALTLPKDAKKRFDIDIWLDGDETSVYIISEFESYKGMVGLPINWIDESTDTILLVSPARHVFDRFERKKEGPNFEQYNPARTIYSTAVDDLPESWRGLDGVETILWNATSVNELTSDQAEAIRDWVGMGGNLILAGGDEAETFFRGPLAEVVPGKYLGRQEVNPAVELAKVLGIPVPTKSEALLAASVSATEGVHWKTEGGLPLLVERRVGLGRVCVVPFDLSSDAASGAKGVDVLVESLLDFRGFTVFHMCSAPLRHTTSMSPPYQGYYLDEHDSGLSETIASSFKHTAGIHVPPARTIASYLGLYIAACLLNLFAWRRAHRREFAWVSLLFLSVGFAGYAWRDASLNAQAAPSVQHVTIQEIGPDGRAGRTTSWFGFYTSISQTVDLAACEPREGVTLAGWDRFSAIGDSKLALMEGEGPLHIQSMPMLPRSVTCARTESPFRPESPMQAKASVRNGALTVSVPRPSEGTPLPPVVFLGGESFILAPSSPQGDFLLARALPPAHAGTVPLPHTEPAPIEILCDGLAARGVESSLLSSLRSDLTEGPRNGEHGFVVLPVFDDSRVIQFAGRRVDADRGLTLMVFAIRWEAVDNRTWTTDSFCRVTIPERDRDGEVEQYTPLWEGPPSLRTMFNWEKAWLWGMATWRDELSAIPSEAVSPFSGAIRVKVGQFPEDRRRK